jgi:hypothetical protein
MVRMRTTDSYPPPREYWSRRPVAIDFYNNYITNSHDNPIEADGSMHNIRVMRNMLISSASHPMSTQPSTGGPVYFIRNIAYHAPGGSTRLTAGSPVFSTTTRSSWTSAGASSNVLAQQPDAGLERAAGALQRNTNTNYSSSDYNGLAAPSRSSGTRRPSMCRRSSPMAEARQLEVRKFAPLEAYAQATKRDSTACCRLRHFMKVSWTQGSVHRPASLRPRI